jgi:hypothetical protein
MDPRFSNVVIRGLLAIVRRPYILPECQQKSTDGRLERMTSLDPLDFAVVETSTWDPSWTR